MKTRWIREVGNRLVAIDTPPKRGKNPRVELGGPKRGKKPRVDDGGPKRGKKLPENSRVDDGGPEDDEEEAVAALVAVSAADRFEEGGTSGKEIEEEESEEESEEEGANETEEESEEEVEEGDVAKESAEGSKEREETVEEDEASEDLEKSSSENEEDEEDVEKSSSGNEEDEDEDGRSSTDSESEGDEELTAIQPVKMYFPPSEYKKKIKISTRCYIYEALSTLESLDPPLNRVEKEWFWNHPQFKHFFHMPRDRNHKVMGMWMLLLRTACIEKEKEVWFVVNGIPIRYGLREHALISGLNCRNYPMNFMSKGSKNFVQKHFKGIVRPQDVKEKLESMGPSRDRLKMAVLFFLSSVIGGQTKCGAKATPVLEFLQRAVDDLDLCQTFPWGRLCFDYMLVEIAHTMTHFGGEVKDVGAWPIPGFCIPLELLAFEAIEPLARHFRESVLGADMKCPRMCKSKFKKSELKGFLLPELYAKLGDTTDIDSIVPAIGDEKLLLEEMTEEEDVDDRHDFVVDSWMKILRKGKLVEFEEMLKADMAGRVVDTETVKESDIHCIQSRELGSSSNPTLKDLIELVDNMKNDMGARFKVIEDKLETQDSRFAVLEGLVKEKSGEHEKSGDQEEGEQDKEGGQEKEIEMVNEGLTIDDAAASEPQGNESGEKEKSGENSKVIEDPLPENVAASQAADKGVKKKRKGADRTVVQEKPSRPVTRSRKN